MSERVQIVLDDDTAAWIADRAERALFGGSSALRVKTELQTWRDHLRAELDRMRFTLEELGLIANVLSGSLGLDGGAGLTVTFELADAFSIADAKDLGGPGSFGRHHDTDEGALLLKVSRLGPTGQHALADAVSRWWAAGHEYTPEGWAAVGIRAVDAPRPAMPRTA